MVTQPNRSHDNHMTTSPVCTHCSSSSFSSTDDMSDLISLAFSSLKMDATSWARMGMRREKMSVPRFLGSVGWNDTGFTRSAPVHMGIQCLLHGKEDSRARYFSQPPSLWITFFLHMENLGVKVMYTSNSGFSFHEKIDPIIAGIFRGSIIWIASQYKCLRP